MSFLTKLFGQKYRVRFEGITYNGQTLKGKATIEVFNCDKEDIIEGIKDMLYTEKGVKVKNIKLLSYYKI